MTDQELKDLVAGNALAISKMEERDKERDQRDKERDQRDKERDQRDKERDQRMEERDKKRDREFEQMKKAREKTNEKREKISEARDQTSKKREKTSEAREKVRQDFRKVVKKYDDIGMVQGKIVEDGLYRSVKNTLDDYGIHIKEVLRNEKRAGTNIKGEYDTIAINDKEIVVIEAKNQIKGKYINHLINVQLPKFKILFPEYKDYTLYGGIGGLYVSPEMEEFAKNKGLFVFTQKNDSFKLLNKKGFKPKVFG